MSFSPDADFPLINVEKGRFTPRFPPYGRKAGRFPGSVPLRAG